MSLEASEHWRRKRRYRPDITDEAVVFVVTRGSRTRDVRWEGVFNSVMRVPPSGRTLKVVYRMRGPKR